MLYCLFIYVFIFSFICIASAQFRRSGKKYIHEYKNLIINVVAVILVIIYLKKEKKTHGPSGDASQTSGPYLENQWSRQDAGN